MKRFAAHLVYCNPHRILSKGIVEVDEQGIVTAIYSLNDLTQETHSTIFYNGILIPALLDKENLPSLNQESMLDTLNANFSGKKKEIKEGLKADFYLLEKVDLIGMKFLKETTLTQLL